MDIHPLEAAAIETMKAVDARGLKIILCRPLDVEDVKRQIVHHAEWLKPGGVFLHEDQHAAELNAARNLQALVNLYVEHLKCGPSAMLSSSAYSLSPLFRPSVRTSR